MMVLGSREVINVPKFADGDEFLGIPIVCSMKPRKAVHLIRSINLLALEGHGSQKVMWQFALDVNIYK